MTLHCTGCGEVAVAFCAIQASEKLFYKKVLDIYATAVDYDQGR